MCEALFARFYDRLLELHDCFQAIWTQVGLKQARTAVQSALRHSADRPCLSCSICDDQFWSIENMEVIANRYLPLAVPLRIKAWQDTPLFGYCGRHIAAKLVPRLFQLHAGTCDAEVFFAEVEETCFPLTRIEWLLLLQSMSNTSHTSVQRLEECLRDTRAALPTQRLLFHKGGLSLPAFRQGIASPVPACSQTTEWKTSVAIVPDVTSVSWSNDASMDAPTTTFTRTLSSSSMFLQTVNTSSSTIMTTHQTSVETQKAAMKTTAPNAVSAHVSELHPRDITTDAVFEDVCDAKVDTADSSLEQEQHTSLMEPASKPPASKPPRKTWTRCRPKDRSLKQRPQQIRSQDTNLVDAPLADLTIVPRSSPDVRLSLDAVLPQTTAKACDSDEDMYQETLRKHDAQNRLMKKKR